MTEKPRKWSRVPAVQSAVEEFLVVYAAAALNEQGHGATLTINPALFRRWKRLAKELLAR